MKRMVFLTLFLSLSVQAQEVSVNSQQRLDYVQKVYNDFNKDNLSLLDSFYDKNVVFLDPIGRHEGLDSIKTYYANMYKNVTAIKFDFTEAICDGDNCVFNWVMTYSSKSINDGQPVTAIGNSHIRFNAEGKVIYHRDYFDMGEFIYEQIPVLGWLIKKVKVMLGAKG